jgi:hypothetical protein
MIFDCFITENQRHTQIVNQKSKIKNRQSQGLQYASKSDKSAYHGRPNIPIKQFPWRRAEVAAS